MYWFWHLETLFLLKCRYNIVLVSGVQQSVTVCRLVMSDSLRLHGILQARILEWVAFAFSRGSSQPRDRTQVSCVAGGYTYIYIYICIHSLFDSFLLLFIIIYWIELSILYSRSLLHLYFISGSMHTLILYFQFIPPPLSPLISLLSMSVNLSLFCK